MDGGKLAERAPEPRAPALSYRSCKFASSRDSPSGPAHPISAKHLLQPANSPLKHTTCFNLRSLHAMRRLRALEDVQVRELLERTHALVVGPHHLLVVEKHPALVRADVRDVMARVHARALVRHEGFQAVARREGSASPDLGRRRCGRGASGLLARVVWVREKPLDGPLRVGSLQI